MVTHISIPLFLCQFPAQSVLWVACHHCMIFSFTLHLGGRELFKENIIIIGDGL